MLHIPDPAEFLLERADAETKTRKEQTVAREQALKSLQSMATQYSGGFEIEGPRKQVGDDYYKDVYGLRSNGDIAFSFRLQRTWSDGDEATALWVTHTLDVSGESFWPVVEIDATGTSDARAATFAKKFASRNWNTFNVEVGTCQIYLQQLPNRPSA